jgi:hypothetical protein
VVACPGCGAHVQREVPWLSRLLGGLAAMLVMGMLSGVAPFDGSTSWLRRGVGLAALLAALAGVWWSAQRISTLRWLEDPRPHRRGSKRLLAVLLVAGTVVLSLGGLFVRGYRDGDRLLFSPPQVLGDVGERWRNQALRGLFVDKGEGPGQVRGMVVDAFPHQADAATTIVDSAGGSMTYYSGPHRLLKREQLESVRPAGQQLCRTAAGLLAHFRPFRRLLPGFPYPARDQVRFYVLTDDDVLVADAALADLSSPSHPLSSLWSDAQKVRLPSGHPPF